MADNVVFTFGADSSKAATEFEKMKDKVASLTAKIEEMAKKSKKSTDDMVKGFKGFTAAADNAGQQMAMFNNGLIKMGKIQEHVTKTSDFVFPKMASSINKTENATASLITRTLTYASALAATYKILSAVSSKLKENKDLEDASYRDVGQSQNKAFIAGNISEAGKQAQAGFTITSQAERFNATQTESSDITAKLFNQNVSTKNINKFDAVYKLPRATGTKDAGQTTESFLTMYKLAGGDVNKPDKAKADYVAGLMSKGFGLESDQAGDLMAGLSPNLSLEDKIALSNASKNANFSKVRPSKTLVKEATGGDKGKITDKTFKMLGITREQYQKAKTDLTDKPEQYLESSFQIGIQSPEAKDIKIKNLENREFSMSGQLDEIQKKRINKTFNKSSGRSGTMANEIVADFFGGMFGDVDKGQAIADWLQNPEILGAKSNLQKDRAEYQAKAVKTSLDISNLSRSKDQGSQPVSTSGDSK